MKSFFWLAAFIACVCCQDDGNDHDNILNVNKKMFERAKSGISGFSGGEREIREEDMLEGDIVMTPQLRQYLKDQEDGKAISSFEGVVSKKWPNARVPYKFRWNFKYRSTVRKAIAEFNKKTCIRFVPKTSSDRNYIEFMHGGGCYSYIGKVGGKQDVSLGRGCNYKGTAMHEMMHALGFFHEQSRRDRDNHIRIVWSNINRKMWSNFKKYGHGEADTFNEPYDKQSIMHYGNYAFSTNRQKTIVSLTNPNEKLGTQFAGYFSRIDARQLNKMYCKNTVTTTTARPIITERPPPIPECTDGYSYCPTLARVGLCNVRITWVKTNCKKSCKNCPIIKELPKCKHTRNRRHCPRWAKLGYCKKHYVTWMGNHCSQCNKCIN